MMNKKKIAAMMMAVSMTGTMAMSAFAEDAPATPPEEDIIAASAASVSIVGDMDGTGEMKNYQIKQNDDGSYVLVDEDGNETPFDFKFKAEGADGDTTEMTVSYSIHDSIEANPEDRAKYYETLEGVMFDKMEGVEIPAAE